MALNDNNKSRREIVRKLINTELTDQDDEELMDLLINQPIAIDVDKQEDSDMTRGDKIADKISEIAGSWGFIIGFVIFLIIWMAFNFFGIMKLDAFPFILLNLLLSCLAALQAPIIMMSQNRQAHKDSIRNQNDYRTDLKSELITEEMHEKIVEILRNQRKILRLLDDDDENEENTKDKDKKDSKK